MATSLHRISARNVTQGGSYQVVEPAFEVTSGQQYERVVSGLTAGDTYEVRIEEVDDSGPSASVLSMLDVGQVVPESGNITDEYFPDGVTRSDYPESYQRFELDAPQTVLELIVAGNGSTGEHTLTLEEADGTVLDTLTFTTDAAHERAQVPLSAPIDLPAASEYRARIDYAAAGAVPARVVLYDGPVWNSLGTWLDGFGAYEATLHFGLVVSG